MSRKHKSIMKVIKSGAFGKINFGNSRLIPAIGRKKMLGRNPYQNHIIKKET